MVFCVQRVYDYQGEFPAVLVDRLWPRGISKTRLDGVRWVKNAAPTQALRQWFHQDRSRYSEFCRLYAAELQSPPGSCAIEELRGIERQHGQLVLLTAVKDIPHSHLPTLLEVLANIQAA